MVLTPRARRIRGKSRRRENEDFNIALNNNNNNNDIYYLISNNNNIYYIYTVYGVLTVRSLSVNMTPGFLQPGVGARVEAGVIR